MNDKLTDKINKLPNSPGVYLFKDKNENIVYVGKAGSLLKRVKSYFLSSADPKAKKMVESITDLDYKKTETVIEALILEAKLIKGYMPFFNIKDKDDKSFLYLIITSDEVPRVLLKRGRDKKDGKVIFGPFVSSSSIREALKIIRRIFPYNSHSEKELIKSKRSCFNHQIGICPGACAGELDKEEYQKNIKNIKLFFQGKKKKILKELEKEMKELAKAQEFEKANKIKKQINSINHIYDTALITAKKNIEIDFRIEGYDISNIGGKFAVGSMVVFENGLAKKEDYKKFKIKNNLRIDDLKMMQEILERRFNHNWKLPDIVLVDGGVGQVNIAKKILKKKQIKIPVIGIAKGVKRIKNEIIGDIPEKTSKETLIKVRDEAHRFAINYHKKLREKDFIK